MGENKSKRRIDNLGRIVIPMDMRRHLEIEDWDELVISVSGNTINIEKAENECTFCHSKEDLVLFRDKHICRKCLSELK